MESKRKILVRYRRGESIRSISRELQTQNTQPALALYRDYTPFLFSTNS